MNNYKNDRNITKTLYKKWNIQRRNLNGKKELIKKNRMIIMV